MLSEKIYVQLITYELKERHNGIIKNDDSRSLQRRLQELTCFNFEKNEKEEKKNGRSASSVKFFSTRKRLNEMRKNTTLPQLIFSSSKFQAFDYAIHTGNK